MQDRAQLIQEEYINTQFGEWKVLVICQTLNQTTYMQAEKVLTKLFERFPSPHDLAFISEKNIPELSDILKSLGLVSRRTNNMLKMSLQYVIQIQDLKDDNDAGWMKYDVTQFAGCGQYASDAWGLFVLKEPRCPKDRRLRDYAIKVGLFRPLEGSIS
jgi:endonuclease III